MGEIRRTIELQQFLKWQGLVPSGGQAKVLIQSGRVRVNGQVETRRSRKLVDGDVVTIDGASHTVALG